MHESTASFIEAEAEGHTWVRRSWRPEDDHVLENTRRWLRALPQGVRPVRIPVDFPRIANDLSRLWFETAALDTYFAEMEFSSRNDRLGFCALIKEELLALHVYSLRNRPLAYESRVPRQTSLLG